MRKKQLSRSQPSLATLLSIVICMCCCIQIGFADADLRLINIADSKFQKIFYIQQKSKDMFLTLTCKQKNMLSVLISTELNYELAPRFNIYGNHKDIPKMAYLNNTSLDQCRVSILLNTTNLIEIRRLDSQMIMQINNITFQQLHLQFVLRDESQKWGMGQRFQKHFDLKDGEWTIYNRDKPWKIDTGKIESSDQTYGHHPVYLARSRETKLYHLVYFRNTHGMLVESSEHSNQLVYNAIGGNIHLIIICGEKDPQQVIQQYHSYIGASHIPPFWSLGYHQSRWGYQHLGYIQQVIQQFKRHKLPLDCIWADLDYMKDKKIFTINEETFPPNELNKLMYDHQMHFVPLIDVAIAVDDDEAAGIGKHLDVFLKENINEDLYTGEVWPDYLHPNASQYWYMQLQRLNNKINFSGIWLDMNEPTNFKGGKVAQQTFRIQHTQGINTMTIDADLRHFSRIVKNLFHREVHSYYGHLSAVPTFQYLQRDNRPFIISRSTSVGSGMFAGHWTGDNVASWQFLRLSISGNFLFQIFGIQMVGADICGFYQDTTQQLCSRWMQLGSFYPFARNHNHEKAVSQQPYEFGQLLLETSRLSFLTRYSLLKQLYTFMVQKKGKGSFFRPLNFQFFDDENVYDEQTIETQFLMGKCLMIAPIVYEGDDSRYVYFPGQEQGWYNFEIDVKSGKVFEKQISYYMSSTIEGLDNVLPSPPLTFLRGGYMLFLNKPATRANKLSNSFNIFAALKDDKAVGYIMGIDDYQKQTHLSRCIAEGCFFKVIIRRFHEFFHLQWQFNGNWHDMGTVVIESITVVDENIKWKDSQRFTLDAANGAINFLPQRIFS